MDILIEVINRDNREIRNFLMFLTDEIGRNKMKDLADRYIQINELKTDRRERRNIQEEKIKKRWTEMSQLIDSQIPDDVKDIGLDLLTLTKRKINGEETIITLFEDGHHVKKQELGGIHIIAIRNMTMKYDPGSNDVSYISPPEAEEIDDLCPKKYSFLDARGVKRDYKHVYSKKFHTELYRHINNI